MLMVALVLTLVSGYRAAYFGPFYVVQLHEAGYSVAEVAQIFMLIQNISILLVPLWIGIPVIVYYSLGKKYKLDLASTIIFILTMYGICTAGQLMGYAVYQLQTPNYPVFRSMLPQAFSLTGTFTWSLVGVLAGNYRREIDQKRNTEGLSAQD